jgi:hypothetical protein
MSVDQNRKKRRRGGTRGEDEEEEDDNDETGCQVTLHLGNADWSLSAPSLSSTIFLIISITHSLTLAFSLFSLTLILKTT